MYYCITHLLAELPVPCEGRALRLLELVGEQDLEEVLVFLGVKGGRSLKQNPSPYS